MRVCRGYAGAPAALDRLSIPYRTNRLHIQQYSKNRAPEVPSVYFFSFRGRNPISRPNLSAAEGISVCSVFRSQFPCWRNVHQS